MWSFDNPRMPLSSLITTPAFEEQGMLTLSEFRGRYEYCLTYLIERCHFPAECFQLIVNYKNHGYVLTHQILYLMVLKQIMHQVSYII